MKRLNLNITLSIPFLFITLLCISGTTVFARQSQPDYNIVWNSQSQNSGESMPCGGGDIGLNVWVEDNDVLFYISKSGTFDENNTLLKQGRIRIRLTPNPFNGGIFKQELKLQEGYIEIEGKNENISSKIRIWVDVFNPVVNVDINNNRDLKTEVYYENWRYQDRLLRKRESNQNSYKWAAPEGLKTLKDEISFTGNDIIFYHRNQPNTIFDAVVRQQGMESVKDRMFNPLHNLTSGGKIKTTGLKPAGNENGTYADTDFKAWKLESEKAQRSCQLRIYLHTSQADQIESWKEELNKTITNYKKKEKDHIIKTQKWWKEYWERSYIRIQPESPDNIAFQVGRNYQLFRYMLGCNAFGEYPTKFNGSLFTYDPCYTDTALRFTPDFRNWGGGTHTAQNQRLVYFPMLKSGDTDMMKPQFDFYLRTLPAAELRSEIYWGHQGACFTEQLENFGLPNPSEYGWKRPETFDKGMEYNAWLEYQWDTALEFCYMILEKERYTGKEITEYIPLIESCLRFFDEHYQYLARQRGRKVFDDNGRLVLYPGSACETYKMATNATSTIAALQTVLTRSLELPDSYLDTTQRNYFQSLLARIPEIRTREIEGKQVIAPAWLWERVNNVESPQLYPVYPWGIYGVGKPDLETAINTWKYDPDVIKFRSHIGWKQDVIWAARLGLTEEAKDLLIKKMQDSGRRFPTFWGPGFDWTPDHNWGGSGMIALQEMLLQADGKKIILFPAWPKEWDVHFKLHAPYNTTIECSLKNGKMEILKVIPESRKADIISM